MKQSELLQLVVKSIEKENFEQLRQYFRKYDKAIDFLFTNLLINGGNLLHLCTKQNNPKILQFVLQHPLAKKHINDQDESYYEDNKILYNDLNGVPPIYYASSTACAKLLISISTLDINSNFFNAKGIESSILHKACESEQSELLKLWVSHADKKLINKPDSRGLTPLQLTLINFDELKPSTTIEIVSILLSHNNIDVNATTKPPTCDIDGQQIIDDGLSITVYESVPKIGTSVFQLAKKTKNAAIIQKIKNHKTNQ